MSEEGKCPACGGENNGLHVCMRCWNEFNEVMGKIQRVPYLMECAKGRLKIS